MVKVFSENFCVLKIKVNMASGRRINIEIYVGTALLFAFVYNIIILTPMKQTFR